MKSFYVGDLLPEYHHLRSFLSVMGQLNEMVELQDCFYFYKNPKSSKLWMKFSDKKMKNTFLMQANFLYNRQLIFILSINVLLSKISLDTFKAIGGSSLIFKS